MTNWFPGMAARDPQTNKVWRYAHPSPGFELWVDADGRTVKYATIPLGACPVPSPTPTASGSQREEDLASILRAREAGPEMMDSVTRVWLQPRPMVVQ